MAKKLPTERTLQIAREDGNWQLRYASYGQPEDTVDASIRYQSTGVQVATPCPRDLTAGELAGTVQALLDACDAEIETAEGI